MALTKDAAVSKEGLTAGDKRSYKKKFGESKFGDGDTTDSQKGWVDEERPTDINFTEES